MASVQLSRRCRLEKYGRKGGSRSPISEASDPLELTLTLSRGIYNTHDTVKGRPNLIVKTLPVEERVALGARQGEETQRVEDDREGEPIITQQAEGLHRIDETKRAEEVMKRVEQTTQAGETSRSYRYLNAS
ncbi:hypothetical protein NP233_g236 [Leucocoprinus birnbaumii]|uniref:Uncharacterized protein n=1 Tax=Leucocoprinus birnbaumii TaxID=56174 RepID=A0AAD5W386_9AGAR|nr:hypothetical protein NP233_g236 [Leucocoprinus birnbaumii]